MAGKGVDIKDLKETMDIIQKILAFVLGSTFLAMLLYVVCGN